MTTIIEFEDRFIENLELTVMAKSKSTVEDEECREEVKVVVSSSFRSVHKVNIDGETSDYILEPVEEEGHGKYDVDKNTVKCVLALFSTGTIPTYRDKINGYTVKTIEYEVDLLGKIEAIRIGLVNSERV